MDYLIQHIFDSPLFIERLEYYDTKEKLMRERSKQRVTFRDGGEIRIFSGNANNSQATRKALMGFGAPNVILDESALISDDLYATVKRMVGGTQDNFLLEIGNPFYRNHFMRTWDSKLYVKIFVDVYKALEEGRYTKQYIEEMREEAFFEVLYECKFPEEVDILPSGYRRLLKPIELDESFIDSMPEIEHKLNNKEEKTDQIDDQPILGIDVAGGGKADTKFSIRYPKQNFAFVAATYDGEDLAEAANIAEALITEHQITDYRIVIDAGGVGHGLPPIMRARGYLVKAVLFGDKAPEPSFANMRAWMYWQARKWIALPETKLVRDDGFNEMKLIYYKQNATYKLQVEPKEDMIKRNAADGIKVSSPDTADAFILTFADTSTIIEEDDIDFD
jgi:hypothetical protein